MDVQIRSINDEVWHAIRLEALRQHLTLAEMITLLWREYTGAQPEPLAEATA